MNSQILFRLKPIHLVLIAGSLMVLLNSTAYGVPPGVQPTGTLPAATSSADAATATPDTSGTTPPPQLIFPSDEAVNLPVTTFLRWQTVDEADAYRVQLSLDEHFRDQIADSAYVTATIVEPDTLLFDRVYYWRVQSVRDGTGGRWSQVRSFSTVVEPPPVTVLTVPDADAVHVSVTPKLSWEPAGRAASYRLQLSETPGFETVAYEAETDLNEHIPERLEHLTRYYWRVRGENAGGAGPWSGVRGFVTIIAAPAMPALSVPHDAARHVTIHPGLEWEAAERAESYRIQVSASERFDSLLVDLPDVINTALYLDSLAYNTSWYWRVRAVNIGGSSAWSRTFRFTTIIERPVRPEPAYPVPDTLHQPVSPELVWHRAARAATYRFQLSRTPDFRQLVYDETGISDTTYAVFFLDHLTPYYWRVRASNTGGFSDWSHPRKFTTIIAVPGKPAVVTPQQDDIHIPVRLTANWTRPERATSYRIQVARTDDFRFPVVGRNAITDTITTVNGLDHNETFHLRVRAVNIGGEGEWSDPVRFRTVVKEPDQPVTSAPGHLSQHIAVNTALRWKPTRHAAAYNLQVSVYPDFRFLIANVHDIPEPAYKISGLRYETVHYWRVRAMNTGGLSAWSDSRQFTTIVAAPDSPEAVRPEKFGAEQPLRTRLVWKSGPGAAQYTVQLAVNAEFSDILHEKKEIRDTTYTTPSLQHERTYFWRVKSVNRGGESVWSEIFHFTTVMQAPPAPELVSPDHYMFDVPTSSVLAWNSVSRAGQYDVQVSSDPDFSSLEIDTSGVEILYLDYSSLEGNSDYYWRVRAANRGGKSDWSEVWTFTTARPGFRSNLPTEVTLQQNHPNPFNPATQIRYGLPELTDIRLEVYNMLGQLVSVLVSGQQPAGYHTATFDASSLSNGIYVYRLFVGNEVITRKMTLVK